MLVAARRAAGNVAGGGVPQSFAGRNPRKAISEKEEPRRGGTRSVDRKQGRPAARPMTSRPDLSGRVPLPYVGATLVFARPLPFAVVVTSPVHRTGAPLPLSFAES